MNAIRKQHIETLRNVGDHIEYNEEYGGSYYTSAFCKAIEFALELMEESEQQWIPVKELPKQSGDYLAQCHHYRNGDWCEVVPFDADKGQFVDLGKRYYPFVTHWMPLPQAPGKDST